MRMLRLTSGLGLALLVATAACERQGTPSLDAPGAVEVAGQSAMNAADEAPTIPAQRPEPVPAAPTTPLVITGGQIEAEFSGALAQCLNTGDAAKGVSVAMGECFNTELQAQDARLNIAYRQAMAGRNDPGKVRLRTEERAWIRQRDSGCQQAATGGTIDMVEIPSCLLTETVRRRLVLEAAVGPS